MAPSRRGLSSVRTAVSPKTAAHPAHPLAASSHRGDGQGQSSQAKIALVVVADPHASNVPRLGLPHTHLTGAILSSRAATRDAMTQVRSKRSGRPGTASRRCPQRTGSQTTFSARGAVGTSCGRQLNLGLLQPNACGRRTWREPYVRHEAAVPWALPQKHITFLTDGTGNPHPDRQISSVTTLMRIAGTPGCR